MFRWRALGLTFLGALPALMTPAIILGGMTFGWFTPTEAAIAACAWALILGVFLYRSLSWKQFYKVTLDTVETTAGVLLDRRRRLAVRLGADDDAADRGRRRRAAVGHRQPLRHPALDQHAAARRRLLPRDHRLDLDPGAGADAGRSSRSASTRSISAS